MSKVSGPELRDPDIRGPLEKWLLGQHAGDPDTVLIHEFKMPRPSARADIALINGKMIAFEIKSDVDSLARLPRQLKAFSRIFDRVSVVTTDKHLKTVKSTVPSWCGVIVLRKKHGNMQFVKCRRGRKLSKPDLASLLHALERKELAAVLSAHDAAYGTSQLPKSELVCLAAGLGTSVRDTARRILRQRSGAITAA